MYETLTPRENLTFAAAFILPKLSDESRSMEVGQLGNLENYELYALCISISKEL